jgi:hypothetical protein
MNEVIRRKQPMNEAVLKVDPALFNASLMGWLEITAFVMAQRAGKAQPNPDGSVPALTKADLNLSSVQGIANDSVFAFCISAALRGDGDAVKEMEKGLTAQYGENFPGYFALWHFRQEGDAPETLEDHIGLIGKNIFADAPMTPKDIWNAGLRFFEKARKSNYVVELIPQLAQWYRYQWKMILIEKASELHMPEETVEPLKEVVADDRDDESFIASLVLAGMPAVDMELDEDYMGLIKSTARR